MFKPMIGVSYPGVAERHIAPIKAIAEKYGYDVKFGQDAWAAEPGKAVTEDWYQGCEIIFGYPDPPLVAGFKDLKWLQSDADGIEEQLKPGYLPEHVLFSNATGAYGETIAEHVLTQLLILYKHGMAYFENQKSGRWHIEGRIKMIKGSVVTIVGFGDLGKNIATRIHALGAVVRGVKRTPAEKPNYLEALYTITDIDKALDGTDVVILSLPGIPSTENIFNRERIFSLKKGSYLINVARSNVWDQDAMCDALRQGHLAGVSTDVAHPEPLPPDSPLWTIPNLIVTPHSAGGLVSDINIDAAVKIFLDNLEAYATGTPMKNLVNRELRY